MDLIHRRLNHSDPALIRVMYDRGLAEGFKLPKGKSRHDRTCMCDACRIARASRAATPNVRRFDRRYTRPFGITCSDLKGPLPMAWGGYRF